MYHFYPGLDPVDIQQKEINTYRKKLHLLNSLCQGCCISTATRPGKEGATLRAHAEKNGGDAPGGFKHAVIYAQEPLNNILVHACMQFGHV